MKRTAIREAVGMMRRGVLALGALAAFAGGCAADQGARSRLEPEQAEPLAARRIDDQAISRAVEAQLVVSPVVSEKGVEAISNEGVVTLLGTVGSLRAKDRAVALTEQIKGVRSVIDQLQVLPAARADSEILQDLANALALEPALPEREIDLRVADGKVTLAGQVDSWQERALAADLVKGVRGVKALENKLIVVTVGSRTDSEIKHDVAARLRRDAWVDAGLISVAVDSGTVSLRGTVGSAAEKTRAWEDAWVVGVREVDASGLAVKWWARDAQQRQALPLLTDEELREAVQDALRYDPRVAAYQPLVQVEDRTVTLSGSVPTLQAKRAAEDDASNTVGVGRVINLLRVEPLSLMVGANIADKVEQVLGWDPVLYRFDIQVAEKDGLIQLTGMVHDSYEKQLAAELAANVTGVLAVDNDIVTSTPVPIKTDAELLSEIRERLFWSPFVDEQEVSVSVNGGVATLSGQVDSWAERRLAARNAREAGAVVVRNRLELRPARAS